MRKICGIEKSVDITWIDFSAVKVLVMNFFVYSDKTNQTNAFTFPGFQSPLTRKVLLLDVAKTAVRGNSIKTEVPPQVCQEGDVTLRRSDARAEGAQRKVKEGSSGCSTV